MNEQPHVDPIPTIAEVARIISLSNPVIRNLHITQCYHELALAMTLRTGVTANWCTFATWASRQAGQTIRSEDLARVLERALIRYPVSTQAVPDVVAAAQEFGSNRSTAEIEASIASMFNPLGALARASDAVARGNRKVFEEIGHEFARFVATCPNDGTADLDKLTRFLDELRPGEPPDGQRYLRQAFSRYYQAFMEPDTKTRAELILLANIEIGLHEQTRLQPEIAEAMNAAFGDRRQFRTRLIQALFPYRGWLARLQLFFLRLLDRPSPLDQALDLLLTEVSRRARLLITEYLMTIELARGVRLNLGYDVPAEYPVSLQQIALPDLRALLEQFDPTPNSPLGSGVIDWSDLPDRMHFIIELFRCYQETLALFEPPFTAEQIAAFRTGRIPDSL